MFLIIAVPAILLVVIVAAWIWLPSFFALGITAGLLAVTLLVARNYLQSLRPKRPVLYAFTHYALRDAAFENHPELLEELAGERSPLPLLHFRSRASILCQDNGLVPPDYDFDDAAGDEEMAMFQSMTISRYQESGYTLHLVTLPRPIHPREAYFVAIAYKDDEPHEYPNYSPSTRYFTLERVRGGYQKPALCCEWRSNGTHTNHGVMMAPDAEQYVAFLLAVLTVNSAPPASTSGSQSTPD